MTDPDAKVKLTPAMIEAGRLAAMVYRSAEPPLADEELAERIYTAMQAARPIAPVQDDDAELLSDALDDILRPFHYEAFVAGVLYERGEWPQDDEEWADAHHGIQSEAVGEHYEAWDVRGKLIATFAERIADRLTPSADHSLVEALRRIATNMPGATHKEASAARRGIALEALAALGKPSAEPSANHSLVEALEIALAAIGPLAPGGMTDDKWKRLNDAYLIGRTALERRNAALGKPSADDRG